MRPGAKRNSRILGAVWFAAACWCALAQGQNLADLPEDVGPTMTAKPFDAAQKAEYRFLQTVGLRGYFGTAAGAAIGQGLDHPKEWGQGWGAYSERFASQFGEGAIRQTVTLGLEEALHEDPRYFPSESKGFKARMKSVLLQAVVTRTDSGKETFAWARMASAFASGEIVNAWQPPSTRGADDGLMRGCLMLAGDVAYNFFQEFVPFVRPRGLQR